MTQEWATPESRFHRSSAARRSWSVCLLGLALVNFGCSLVANATRNLVYETTLCADDVRTEARTRKLANAAWQEACKRNPRFTCSAAYKRGFKDGFLAMQARGRWVPLSFSPPHYGKPYYVASNGQQAVSDWSAGYHDGAGAAQSRDHAPHGEVASPVDRLPASLSDSPPVKVMFQPHTGESVYAPAPSQAVR